jgi:hypothetical protein
MHAYRHPGHEQRVAALARELGFAQVSASHEASPLIKLVSRGDTTVVDAYLSPILRDTSRRAASGDEKRRGDTPLHPPPEGERVGREASGWGEAAKITPPTPPASARRPSPLQGEVRVRRADQSA